MRKNRKMPKKMSVVTSNVMHFGGLILISVVMVIVNHIADTTCDQLVKSIGEKERQLAQLEEERVRESARWEEMKTPERLESVLYKHGLAMKYPRPDQVVRMKPDGRPYPGQLSVAKARQRNGFSAAQYQDETLPRGRRRSSSRRSN